MDSKAPPIVYWIAIISSLGGFLFGYNLAVISGALLFISEQLNLTTFQVEWLVGSLLIGAMWGAIFSGKMADFFGRQKSLLLITAFFVVGTLITVFAKNLTTLVIGRLVLGYAIGVVSMVVPLYISEMSPAKKRGFLVSFNQLMITIGIFFAYLVNFLFAGSGNWPYMFALALIPSCLMALGMLFLPESPRWLIKYNHDKKAKEVLHQLHKDESLHHLATIREAVNKPELKFSALLHKARLPALLIGMGLAIFQQITGINAVIYYAPIIFQKMGLSSNVVSILATLGLGLINVIVTSLTLPLIDKVGRRPLLLIGLVGIFISLVALGLIAMLGEPSITLGWITVLFAIFYVGSFAMSLGPLFWLIAAEIFPLSLRGKAMALASLLNWASNLLVAMTFLTLSHLIGTPMVFWLYGLLTFFCFLFVYYLVPETKGKTLEEIERFWD